VSWQLYLSLSAMMYLDYAVRGSWGPVLSAHLLGPLKMTGKQASWVYAMYPLGCIVAPMIGGQIVDRWIPTEWFLGIANLVGGVALLFAMRATTFRSMLGWIGLHCLFFAPTIGLISSLAFAHMPDPSGYFRVRVWSSVAWVTVGWILSGWRSWSSRKGVSFRGSDALLLGAVFSFVMAAYCPLCLPHTPPTGGAHWAAAWTPLVAMLSEWKVLVFLLLSLVICTQLQFYYIGTSKFLEDIGFSRTHVPAIMAVAQIATVASMVAILPSVFQICGYRWTMALGTIFWLALYIAYLIQSPRWLIVVAQGFHGLAYAFFIDTAIIYVNKIAPIEIRHTAQSLFIVITIGLGLFLGTPYSGFVLDRCRREGKIHWRGYFATPCLPLAICIIAFILLFTE